jgi:hypothetical protein
MQGISISGRNRPAKHATQIAQPNRRVRRAIPQAELTAHP